ncbi:g8130 [Coccomyxa elongata]
MQSSGSQRDRDHKSSGDDEDFDEYVDQQGCGKAYSKLEVCLAENNRDWRSCQKEVQAWKDCYNKSQKAGQQKPD